MSLINHLKHFLETHAANLPITLGYSGGLDSSVLLHLLAELKDQEQGLGIRAIHVHHGLSRHADDWLAHCRRTCSMLRVDFDVAYADIKPTRRQSLEQQARDARYALLDKHSDDKAVLLTAQHQDDQAETLMLQLMRGAGPKGLSAMSASDTQANGRQVLRPLLPFTRAELEDYANQHQLRWIEDESNDDNRFDRNFLRNQVMPLLKARWPQASQTISRSAALCQEQQRLIESEASEKLLQAKNEDKSHLTLHLGILGDMSKSWFSQILRLWFREWQVELPSSSVMEQIYQQSIHARDDARVKIQLGDFQLRRYDQKLYLLMPKDLKMLAQDTSSIVWPIDEEPQFDHGEQTYYAETSERGFVREQGEPIVLKFGCLTDKFKYQANRPTKVAKQWFKEWKIPPWERHRIPFFYCGSRLVQIGDKVNLLNETGRKTDLYSIKSIYKDAGS